MRRKRILVGVDGSRPSEWAVEAAGQLAVDDDAIVRLIHVRPFPPQDDLNLVQLEREPSGLDEPDGASLLLDLEMRLPRKVESSVTEAWGSPAAGIVNAARRWGADYIVVGTRGRGRVSRFVLGSTADAVVRLAACPVITVAHPPASLESAGGALSAAANVELPVNVGT